MSAIARKRLIRLSKCTAAQTPTAGRAHRRRAHAERFSVTRAELARLIDPSVLRPEATEGDIRTGADVVRRWKIAYYCVQPRWVAHAAQLLVDTNARIVTVVGFPHGCDRSDVKAHGAA